MRVKYNEHILFDLPNKYNLEERLRLIEYILDEQKDLFTYTEQHDTRYDENINRVLDQFAYYLLTSDKETPDGKKLRNDVYIMRKHKMKSRYRELQLYYYTLNERL